MTDRSESTVDISAEPTDVWEAFEDPDRLDAWFGDGASIELVPGGPVETERRVGVVERVEPGRRLGFCWWERDDADGVSRVDISLDPAPGGTRVRVIEHRPTEATPTMEARAMACLV